MLKDSTLRKNLPFILITLLFITVAFLDRLIPEGMFFDGVVYAALSRNIAIGKGTLWYPYFGHGAHFVDHPTLMLGIESVFFKIFGDHYTTEKIYSFVTWLITVWLIVRLWKSNSSDASFRKSFWLPLLLWSIVPTVLWCYPNNMLESTMCIFDLLAVMALYKASENRTIRYINIILGAIFIFLATLVKGPVGLFPLAIPFLHWLVFRTAGFGRMMFSSIFLIVLITVFYLILVQFPGPKNYLGLYLDAQLFSSIAGEREIVESSLGHFAVLEFLVVELAPTIIFSVILMLAGRLAKVKAMYDNQERKKAIFHLLIGLSASLPIMISIKQRAFYIVPAIPYFAVSLALLVYPTLSAMMNKYTFPRRFMRYFYLTFIIAAIACIPYLLKGVNTVGRDHDVIHDIKLVAKAIPTSDTVGVCPAMLYDFLFRAYSERYYQLETRKGTNARYVLVNSRTCDKAYTDSLAVLGFKQLDIGTWQYLLYKQ